MEEEKLKRRRRRRRSRLRIIRRSRSLTRCRLGRLLLRHVEVEGGEVGEVGRVREGGTEGRRRGRGMWLRLESRVGWG